MAPNGTTVGASASFTATVVADATIRSIDMHVGSVGGTKQSLSMSFVGGDARRALQHPILNSSRCQPVAVVVVT